MFRLSADFSRGDCSFHPAFVFGPPTAVCISSRLRCIFMVLFTAVHLLLLPTYSGLPVCGLSDGPGLNVLLFFRR